MKPEFSRVFIKDDLGDILVLKDRKRKGIWNIPGGKQEINETPLASVRSNIKMRTPCRQRSCLLAGLISVHA